MNTAIAREPEIVVCDAVRLLLLNYLNTAIMATHLSTVVPYDTVTDCKIEPKWVVS